VAHRWIQKKEACDRQVLRLPAELFVQSARSVLMRYHHHMPGLSNVSSKAYLYKQPCLCPHSYVREITARPSYHQLSAASTDRPSVSCTLIWDHCLPSSTMSMCCFLRAGQRDLPETSTQYKQTLKDPPAGRVGTVLPNAQCFSLFFFNIFAVLWHSC
jgi:hypothetical protein